MSEMFLCKRGQLNSVGKHDLRKAGVVVVEVDDPSSCQFIRSSEIMSSDAMLWAAMDALKRNFKGYNEGKEQREQFAFNMANLVEVASMEADSHVSAIRKARKGEQKS